MSVLIVASHSGGRLSDVTYELITAAQDLEGPVSLAVIAREPEGFDVISAGVDEVVHVEVPTGEFDSDVYRQSLRTLITERKPRVVLISFDVNSISYAPAVAVSLGAGFASDVFALRYEGGSLVATRSFYASRVNGDVDFGDAQIVILLLRAGVWAPVQRRSSPMMIRIVPHLDQSRTRHVRFIEPVDEDIDISTADLVLAVGRGIGERENLAVFERLAPRMGAALAASRPLVDSGWLSSARQVGQSGKTVRPKVYLAFGISGAPEHLAGMKESETIVAVNVDTNAPMFNAAHYGAVADLLDVANELEKLY